VKKCSIRLENVLITKKQKIRRKRRETERERRMKLKKIGRWKSKYTERTAIVAAE
jgi:hypothetical protein